MIFHCLNRYCEQPDSARETASQQFLQPEEVIEYFNFYRTGNQRSHVELLQHEIQSLKANS